MARNRRPEGDSGFYIQGLSDQETRVILACFPKYPPTSAREAERWLNDYYAGDTKKSLSAEVITVLTKLSVVGMKSKDNKKDNDRRDGRNKRKKRTGSRKG